MAEEAENTTVASEEMVVITDVPVAEVPKSEQEAPISKPEANAHEPMVANPADVNILTIAKEKEADQSESPKISGLPEHEKKALEELKQLVQEALKKHELTNPTLSAPPHPPADSAEPEADRAIELAKDLEDNGTISKTFADVSVDEDGAKTLEAIEETVVSVVTTPPPFPPIDPPRTALPPPEAEEVSIWGVPLLKDERSDVVLWKFLRARDFKVKEAFSMVKNTFRWRKEFRIDELMEEEMGDDFGSVVFMDGFSKEGHPVCYNVYGKFQSKELYRKAFSDEEKRKRFLRWRIQFLEKSIRKLDFRPGGISTIVQVNDLRDSPGPGKWELRQATKNALQLLQDNYPEFVAKQVLINVPWWYMAVNKMISPFLTQRTKSKFVFAGPSRSAETLFSYIAAEQVPAQYGGLSRREGEFSAEDAATQIIIKPASKETVEFSVMEACHLTWEARVLGWEVSYGAEFVPNAKDGYTIIIQKMRKIAAAATAGEESSIIADSFKIGEPGSVILSFTNATSKKKKLLYRLKIKSSGD
ncbi:hypothetical protein Nepgr_015054 [Nepenthes gracilis]|uniref:Patellin-3 n=1 Tax=Nepenthes gracilis TaxID=150966 RepID=A0AAD3XQE5_NEPGR|nr:hypothetical protein Nepgr_015054 [Nepenthes gracilis]